jgi:hypothetical protein
VESQHEEYAILTSDLSDLSDEKQHFEVSFALRYLTNLIY